MTQTPGPEHPRWLLRSAADVPTDDTWLSPQEQEVQNKLHIVPRRADWRLGRWAAKQALSRHLKEHQLAHLSVLAAEDGAPEAWLGTRRLDLHLSISHRGQQAVAALGAQPLGVDLEHITARGPGFEQSFFTGTEQDSLRRHPNPQLALTLMWSAKESVLKLRRTGLRRDTKGVQIDPPRAALTARWQRLLAHDLQEDEQLVVWWRGLGGAVLTLASLQQGPPQAMDSATACA